MAMMASSNNYDNQVDDFEDDLIDPDDGNVLACHYIVPSH